MAKRYPEVQHLMADSMKESDPLLYAAVRAVAWLDQLTDIPGIAPEALAKIVADQDLLTTSCLKYANENSWETSDSIACPKCGCTEVATIERVYGEAQCEVRGRTVAHTGDTEMDWNDSNQLKDIWNRVVLKCVDCEHQYVPKMAFNQE